MKKRICLSAFLLVVPLTATSAQERQPPLEPGTRVRVTAPSLGMNKQEATFEAWRGDTLVVTTDLELSCPLASIGRLEAYGGRKSRAGKNALWGGVIGVVVGAVLGIAWADICESQNLVADCEWGVLGGGLDWFLSGTVNGALMTVTMPNEGGNPNIHVYRKR